MKSYYHFLIALLCAGTILFEVKYFKTITDHPYMIILIAVLIFGVCYHLGRGFGKMIDENES
jgi:predicted membrane protein